MKKKILTIILSTIIVIVVAIAIYFAYFRVDAISLAHKNISEQDKVCYYANNGNSQVKLISGTREEPYVLNGKSEDSKEFALIIFCCDAQNVQNPTFVASIDDKSYNGILQNNPYDNTFVVDLEISVPENANINIKITINDETLNYEPTSMSKEWKISSEKALDIAIEHFSDIINQKASHKGLDAELYLRIISDANNAFDKFFYHATLTLSQNEAYSIVIDVNTGEIIGKNNKNND